MEPALDIARQYNEACRPVSAAIFNDRGIVDYLIDHHVLAGTGSG